MNNIFLTAEWRKLIMANYVADPKVLLPYLPARTELDYFQGNCYVSLVAFMFVNTRIKNYSIPFHKNFEEVNLRFYVRYRDGDEWKRGVVFIREFVPLPMVTLIANTVYDEKYMTVPMQHDFITTPQTLNVSYRWKKNEWYSVAVRGANRPEIIQEGSKEEFITQHFWGYAKKRQYTSEYQVAHELWKSYPIDEFDIKINYGKCYGQEFTWLDQSKPDSVFLVEGSPVTVFRDRKIF